jgi:hypothetical protein
VPEESENVVDEDEDGIAEDEEEDLRSERHSRIHVLDLKDRRDTVSNGGTNSAMDRSMVIKPDSG